MEVVMSNVPTLRFGEFTDSWTKNRIKDVTTIKGRIGYRGYTKQDLVREGLGALALGGTNIKNNSLSLHENTYISWEKYYESPEIIVERGQIIFVQRGNSLGACALIKDDIGKATINPSMMLFKDLKCNPVFLYNVLVGRRLQKKIESTKTTTAIPMIGQAQLGEFSFLLPNENEQQKIAAFLTAVDTKIEQLTQKEALLKQYKKGVMQKIFSQEIRFKADDGSEFPDWVKKPIGSVANTYQPQTISQSELSANGYTVYGANGIIGYYGEFNHEHEQIAVTCRGNTCGTVNYTVKKAWITGNAMVINLDDCKEVSKRFLYHQLGFTDLTYLITGSGQPQITGDIKSHKIDVPMIEEQLKIENLLDSIELKISILTSQIGAIKAFKKGLLQQMFV